MSEITKSNLNDLAKQLSEERKRLEQVSFIHLSPEFLARIDEIELKARSAFAYALAIGDMLVQNNIVLRDNILRAYTRQLHEIKEFDEAQSKSAKEN